MISMYDIQVHLLVLTQHFFTMNKIKSNSQRISIYSS